MQEKTPGKTKKQEIFITFLQMWTIFPQNPGTLTEKRKAAGLRKSGGLRAKLYKCNAGMTGRKIVVKETQEGCLSL